MKPRNFVAAMAWLMTNGLAYAVTSYSVTDLNSPVGATFSVATDINNVGQVVGSNFYGSGSARAFIYPKNGDYFA